MANIQHHPTTGHFFNNIREDDGAPKCSRWEEQNYEWARPNRHSGTAQTITELDVLGKRLEREQEELLGATVISDLIPTAVSENFVHKGVTNSEEIEFLSSPSKSHLSFSILSTLVSSSRRRPPDMSTLPRASLLDASCGHQDDAEEQELSSLIFSSDDHHPPKYPSKNDYYPESHLATADSFLHLTDYGDFSSLSDFEEDNGHMAEERGATNSSPYSSSTQAMTTSNETGYIIEAVARKVPPDASADGLPNSVLYQSTFFHGKSFLSENHGGKQPIVQATTEHAFACNLTTLLQPSEEAKPRLPVSPKGTRKSPRLLVRSRKKEAENIAWDHYYVVSRRDDGDKVVLLMEDDHNNNKHEEVDPSWYIHYQELVVYKNKHGHCNVPFRYNNDNPFLAAWVKRQRYQYKRKIRGKHSHLTDEREKLLEGLGFVWDSHVAAWEENFSLMADFYQQHGHCCVPIKQKELRNWAKRQRRLYKKQKQLPSTTTTSTCSTIFEDRIRRLNEIRFQWATASKNSTIKKEDTMVKNIKHHEASHNKKRKSSSIGSSTSAHKNDKKASRQSCFEEIPSTRAD